VKCSVLTRFTADPWSDLVAQAVAVEADVVLVDRQFVNQPSGVSTLPVDPAFTLAIADLGSEVLGAGDAVAVVVDNDADGRTALVLASAAAGYLGGSLLVATREGGRVMRRVTAALEPLRTAGLQVQMLDGTPTAAQAPLLLLGSSADARSRAGSGTTVTVQAGLDDREAELIAQLAKLASVD
jgi:hypothetical protein